MDTKLVDFLSNLTVGDVLLFAGVYAGLAIGAVLIGALVIFLLGRV